MVLVLVASASAPANAAPMAMATAVETAYDVMVVPGDSATTDCAAPVVVTVAFAISALTVSLMVSCRLRQPDRSPVTSDTAGAAAEVSRDAGRVFGLNLYLVGRTRSFGKNGGAPAMKAETWSPVLLMADATDRVERKGTRRSGNRHAEAR